MSASETTRPRHVYDDVASALATAGVGCMFGVLGEDTAPLVAAAVARDIVYNAARHENQAVAMADGYSRATGRIGIATVTGGPGFTNALTAINTAYRAGSRVLVLIGAGRAAEDDHAPEVVREANGASWLKYFPQAAVLDVLGIPVVRPQTAEAAATDAARAFALAHQGTVVLVLGRGLLLTRLAASSTTADRVRASTDASAEAPTAIGASPVNPAPRPAAPPFDPGKIGELADLLQETWAVKRPLILAGHGAVAAGAGPALQRLAGRIGAVVATTLRARGLFNGDPFHIGVCGSYSTPVATELIVQADCVLAFGATLNPWTTYGNTLFPRTMLVQIDVDDVSIGRFLPAELGIRGDARAVAEALVDELERRGHQFAGFRSDDVRQTIASYRKDADVVDRSTATRIDPRTLMLELDRILPANRILCVDAGQHARFAIRYLATEQPRNFMQPLDAGALGLAIGAGIGASVGRPENLVVVASGDGGAMMWLGDLESAVRLRLPMLVVVSNDESFGAEVNVLAKLGLDTRLADTPCPSFEAMAKAMGARAATVCSVADLGIVRHWLHEWPRVPLVLDCHVNAAVRAD